LPFEPLASTVIRIIPKAYAVARQKQRKTGEKPKPNEQVSESASQRASRQLKKRLAKKRSAGGFDFADRFSADRFFADWFLANRFFG
jgi:hypothetical protein